MKQSFTNLALSIFAGQLSLILHSGISLSEGILILQEDTTSKEEAALIGIISDELEQTGSFSQALSASGMFPDYFVQMTELGERSGTLEDVLTKLSDYYKQQDSLLNSIRDALLYPLVLLGMLTAVLAVLIHQVMPVFAEVFDQLGLAVSGMAQAVFQISSILQKVSAGLLLLLLVTVLSALFAIRSGKSRTALFGLFRRLPFFQTLLMQTARARFAHALSIALHSGLDMEESFSLAAMLTKELLPDVLLVRAKEQLAQGNELGNVLKESGIFSGLDTSLLSIGFRTGSAETALLQISCSSQQKTEEMILNAVGMIEPTLTAFLSLLTGMILVSVMLPLLSVMSNIG